MDLAQSLPRLRTDLLAQPIDGSDGRFAVDLTDPDSGKTFRFWDIEYHIATAMNGKRDLLALSNWASAELGLQPSTDELMSVIDKLDELGYLDTAVPDAPELGHFTASSPSSPPLQVDDMTLGLAGASDARSDDVMPEAANLELGLAGNADTDANDQATYVAPDLSLGRAGGQRAASGFPGEDEDDVPTSIKDPRRQGRISDPAIPPRPPTSEEPVASLVPSTDAADDEGPTQLPAPAPDFDEDEMSVDLTDHMKLGPEAVKEAVRQSQMIQTVDVDDLPSDELESSEGKSIGKPEVGPEDKPASLLAKPETADSTAKPETVEPTELPNKRAAVSKPSESDLARPVVTATESPSSSSNTSLLVLLLLLLLVGAIAAVYFLDLFGVRTKLGMGENESTNSATVTPSTAVMPATQTPVKIELPTATLEEKDGDPVAVKAAREGVLASVVASGTEVEEGAEIARFRGGEAFEREISNVSLRLDHYQGKLEKAQKSGVEGEIDRAQKKVDEKKSLIDEAQKNLEAYIVRAPQAGTFSTELEEGAKLDEEGTIGTFPAPPILSATFEMPADGDEKQWKEGEEAEIVAKSNDKKRAGCVITSASDTEITVECPSEGGLAAGDAVVLP